MRRQTDSTLTHTAPNAVSDSSSMLREPALTVGEDAKVPSCCPRNLPTHKDMCGIESCCSIEQDVSETSLPCTRLTNRGIPPGPFVRIGVDIE